MAGSWNSQRGDDWWFSGGLMAADGAHSSTANMFEIRPTGFSPIQPGALQDLLVETFRQFKGVKIYLALDSSTRPVLDVLAKDKIITWQEFKQPYSLWAQVLSVVPPN